MLPISPSPTHPTPPQPLASPGVRSTTREQQRIAHRPLPGLDGAGDCSAGPDAVPWKTTSSTAWQREWRAVAESQWRGVGGDSCRDPQAARRDQEQAMHQRPAQSHLCRHAHLPRRAGVQSLENMCTAGHVLFHGRQCAGITTTLTDR